MADLLPFLFQCCQTAQEEHSEADMMQKLSKKSNQATTSTDLYVQELTKRIQHELVDEVEAKVTSRVNEEMDAKVNQKVQHNLTWILKKFGEANPDLKIDIGATLSGDTREDGTLITREDGTLIMQEYDTLVTGGPSS